MTKATKSLSETAFAQFQNDNNNNNKKSNEIIRELIFPYFILNNDI